jgi:hypothetical protein
MKHTSQLSLFCLLALACLTSCSLPTGSFRVTSVVARRCDPQGAPIESIQEDETGSKKFCLYSKSDGAFASKAAPKRLEYSIMAGDGRQERLSFLTQRAPYVRYLAFFPISNGRWIGLVPQPDAPAGDRLGVCVFSANGLLSSNVVPSVFRNESAALLASRASSLLRSEIPSFEYEFDPTRETVTFKTRRGEYVFDANTGDLQRGNE